MHERSLAAKILRMVDEIVAEEGGGRVRAIGVEVGALAGIEPLLLESALRETTVGTASEGAAIDLVERPLTARCENCGLEQTIESFRFVCQGCDANRLRVTGGDAVRLVSVSFEEIAGDETN